jgi:hypothetical protein
MSRQLVGMAPFWFVVGLAARAWFDEWRDNYQVSHSDHHNRKRARGAG